MKLLTNEVEVLKTNDKNVVLTNQRVYMKANKAPGFSKTVTIFLEDISSIETSYKSNYPLQIIAGFCLLSSLYFGFISHEYGSNSTNISIGATVIFYALYWFSRQHIISISSDGGGALSFMIRGMKESEVEDFIYNVQESKSQRMNELYQINKSTNNNS